MAVIVTTESSSSTEVILNIAMDAADEEPFIARSYRRTVGNLAIPGFRKGKAPRSVVENHVGRQALLREALDYMIPETLNRALQDQGLQAFIEPQVEMLEWEPVSFKAVIPLEPAVDLGDFRELRLEKAAVEITAEQIDQVLERLRRADTPWGPADRPARYGDLLNLNVRGVMDGEEIISDDGVDFIPEPGNVLPFPGFAPHLEGLTEGDEKEFVMTVPADYPRPEFAGKEVAFQVTALSIKEKILPELDDEFAKGVGAGFDTLEDLRADVESQLKATAQQESDYEFQELTLARVLGQATIDLSDLVVAREVQAMVEERDRLLRNQRLDLDSYLGYVGKTPEEFREELRPEAIERLERMLVVRQVVKDEEIEVSPEEIQQEMDGILEGTAEENKAAVRRMLNTEEQRTAIYNSMLTRKAMQRLVAIVQGAEESGDTDDDDAAATVDGETAAGDAVDAADAEIAANDAAEPETATAASVDMDTDETVSPAAAVAVEAGEESPAAAVIPETQGNTEGAKPDAD